MYPKFTPFTICLAPNVRLCGSVGCSALGRNGLESPRGPEFFPGFISAIAEIAALLQGSLLSLTTERKWKKYLPKLNQENTI